MGWIAGPICLLFFALVTYYTSIMLAECYRFPDPVTGQRNYTYMDAVKSHLGTFSFAARSLNITVIAIPVTNVLWKTYAAGCHSLKFVEFFLNVFPGEHSTVFTGSLRERAGVLASSSYVGRLSFCRQHGVLTALDVVFAGGVSVALCGLVQYGNLIGTSIGYTITSSISMV